MGKESLQTLSKRTPPPGDEASDGGSFHERLLAAAPAPSPNVKAQHSEEAEACSPRHLPPCGTPPHPLC